MDLDLFTLDDLALPEADILVPKLAFDDLLVKAQQKDLGLQPFYMAGALLEVRRLSRLPVTAPPLALEDLQSFITALADRLLDRIRPPEGLG